MGNAVTPLATALTRAANTEKVSLAERRAALKTKLEGLPGKLREGHPLCATLAGLDAVDAARLAEAHAVSSAAVSKAESDLARGLGVGTTGSGGGLAEALTSGLAAIDRPLAESFPGLAAIQLGGVYLDGGTGAGAGALEPLIAGLDAFLTVARRRITERHNWWRRETESAGRASLLVQAAARYDPETHECPVCVQPIEDGAVRMDLEMLKGAGADLRSDLRVFFRDLADELVRTVPPSVRALSEQDPAARVRSGWEGLKRSFRPALAPLVGRYEDGVAEIIARISPLPARDIELIPTDADGAFRDAARGFVGEVAVAWRGIDTISWGIANLDGLVAALEERLTAPGEAASSLKSILHGWKEAAADVAPVAAVRDELAAAMKEAAGAGVADRELATLNEVRLSASEKLPKHRTSPSRRMLPG